MDFYFVVLVLILPVRSIAQTFNPTFFEQLAQCDPIDGEAEQDSKEKAQELDSDEYSYESIATILQNSLDIHSSTNRFWVLNEAVITLFDPPPEL
ncbi:MAG: hypothetical protein AAF705_19255 [Bacteroidota bacterium]